ncbi:MAG: hypothetical protein ACLQIB_47305 [Isosphaeraceae bacterium]
MNDEIESVLRQVTPPGAPRQLRARVLGAVADELRPAAVPPSRRRFRPGLAVAASLLASVALNYWVNATLDRRLAVVLAPPPVRRQAAEIAADVASITEPSTGKWVYERLTSGRPNGDDTRQYAVRLQQMIRELIVDHKENADEAPEKNPQMDGDRRGSRDHHPAAIECLFRLAHRNTA